jgi:hypothetical protein
MVRVGPGEFNDQTTAKPCRPGDRHQAPNEREGRASERALDVG